MTLQTVMNGRPRKADAERVLARLEQLTEGEVVTHAELVPLSGEQAKNDRYRSIASLALRLLAQKTGVWLASVHGVGYRYPLGREQVRDGLGRMRRATRQIGKAARQCSDVSDERLPDRLDREARDHIVRQTVYLAELAKTERRALEARVRPTETLPSPKN